ncbi:odorant receptor 13a-like [Calliopsis andreniformis]|uniref:odorant receptor 13a-like n=1 Tax=Calliopsis andreniformis TaxID=337506 RepID=UPI003FCD0EAC
MIPLILMSLDSMYICFTQHACAMFAVVGKELYKAATVAIYRLKTVHILNEISLRKEFSTNKHEKLLMDEQEWKYQRLILCIKEHKRALEYTQIVQSTFSVALFVQIFINILLLSITGVQTLFKLADGKFTDVARLITWMMGDHIHLFFLYLPGQKLADSSTQVYYDALECLWYESYKKSRVVYQIMVMNTLTPVKMTALKVALLNMESFLSVTQAAVSYFTVLSSTL